MRDLTLQFDLTPPSKDALRVLVADLSEDERHVLLEHGTEAAFCGVFLEEKRARRKDRRGQDEGLPCRRDRAAMSDWMAAGFYGLLSASGLLAGAVAGLWLQMRHRAIAAVTAVGVGLLIAAASLYLISGALEAVSATTAASGALAGAAAFSLINLALRRWEAEKRKRCGECVRQPSEAALPGSGIAIAFGSLLDAVPEALIIGAAVAGGAKTLPPIALIAAFALANVAEGLSSSAGMRDAGRSRRYCLLVWTGATLVTVAATMLGFALFSGGGGERGWLEAFAAGALIALVVETMAPEAVGSQPAFAGLLAMLGFSALLLALGS